MKDMKWRKNDPVTLFTDVSWSIGSSAGWEGLLITVTHREARKPEGVGRKAYFMSCGELGFEDMELFNVRGFPSAKREALKLVGERLRSWTSYFGYIEAASIR